MNGSAAWSSVFLAWLAGMSFSLQAQTNRVVILEIAGTAGVLPAGGTVWRAATNTHALSPGDRFRVGANSRATLRLTDLSQVRVGELSEFEVQEQAGAAAPISYKLWTGILYFLHRDKPGRYRFDSPLVSAATRGTEFLLAVEESGRTTLTLMDGEVDLHNEAGQLSITTGQQAVAEPGRAPVATAVVQAQRSDLIQWCLYYPAVVPLDELRLGADAVAALRESLESYRRGDLLEALRSYPSARRAASDTERLYRASLLLAVGQVAQAEALLSAVRESQPMPAASRSSLRLREALRSLIATVKGQAVATQVAPVSAAEWLVESYVRQGHSDLPGARSAAGQAVQLATNSGFAWARVAELEFSFGNTKLAFHALDRSLALAPRNAQALALKGFLLSAENRIPEAITWFDRAIAVDGGLGNAWLGRGLCRLRLGRTRDGLLDLQTAATVEPQRALFRSYLGKGYEVAGYKSQARGELGLAQKLDPHDPTSWLYRALLDQQQNLVNTAVDDLEKSVELNDNRRLYRSRQLLDQDRAVRSANLASVYRDAGLLDFSVHEAARAVGVDYANFSAHLFLANSYSDLLNYTPQVNLRYETPRVSEYLAATLLAPVGAGVLSPTVSQQEYSKLFEQDRLGFTSSTEYLSRGAWAESAAQFGTLRNFSYSLDAYYQWDPGQRVNNDLELLSLSARVKQQVTSSDSVFLQLIRSEASFGDLAQYSDPFNPTNGANPLVRSKETQEPILLAGYHHEWSPNSHTLVLAGRLQDALRVENPVQGTLRLWHDTTNGPITAVYPQVVGQDYESELTIHTAEVQQILQRERYALILGGRYQGGHFETSNTNTPTVFPPAWYSNAFQEVRSDFERLSFYGYAQWQALEPLRLIGGVAYDRLTYPANFRYAPISAEEDTTDQVSPKAGFILTPFKDSVLRGAYSRSLGGVSIDQSFRLEPSQVAGFNQAWRSMIPESVAGASAAERFENAGLSLEQRFPTRTYAAVSGEWLRSTADRTLGTFERWPPDFGQFPAPPQIFQSGTRENLDFDERTLAVTVNQLVGEEWAFGARYRLSRAQLDELFPDIPASAVTYGGFHRQQELEATLHQVNLFALFNHPSGVFARFDSLWTAQSNDGYDPDIPGDDFWQFNVQVGYRFPRRQAEVRLGVLNLTDQDYRLNPLNLTSELPRERTLLASLRFSF